jgi:hypothetical protein
MSSTVAAACMACSAEALAASSAALVRTSSTTARLVSEAAAAKTISVTSCAEFDPESGGTLRNQITNSSSGDTIDLSGLPAADPTCTNGTITLSTGAIPITHNLTLLGPQDATLTISAGHNSRIFVDSSTDAPTAYLQLSYLTISNGYTGASGGCIDASGVEVRLNRAVVTNCVISPLSLGGAALGGAINAQAVVMTNGSAVTNNRANFCGTHGCFGSTQGGGIYAASFSCADSTVSGNYAQSGGGIFAGGVTINRCTIDSNATILVTPVTLAPNGYGGGLALRNQGAGATAVTITQSTIANNIAYNSPYHGGGVAIIGGSFASVTIANTTIAGNTSGVALLTGDNVSIESSIIADNGTFDLSVIQDTASIVAAHNLINSLNFTPPDGFNGASGDPQFWPLANHGGMTRTLALQGTSPARNNGSNSIGATTDQRGTGFAREVPVGVPDIGAFELQVVDDEIFWSGF